MNLEILKAFVMDLVLPSFLIVRVVLGNFISTGEWLCMSLGAGSYGLYAFVTGGWDVWGYRVRDVMLTVLILAVVSSFVGAKNLNPIMTIGVKGWLGIVFFFIFSPLAFFAFRGRKLRGTGIDLGFPLKNGLYHVAQGGSNILVNVHYANRRQRFALDIVKLGRLGMRAKGILPKRLDKYSIFGETVYSPIDGTVVKVENNQPDLTPPKMDKDRRLGNYVVLRSESASAYVFLVHLQQRSVLVREGDTIQQGKPLAKVGNSGNSSEPHLHVHATTAVNDTFESVGESIPLLFGARFLKRNDVVRC
jgi:hypothetical protein